MKKMSHRALVIALAGMALGVVIDQWTKIWAAARLPGSPLTVIDGALTFQYVENRNAAFGLGKQLPESVKVYILLGLTIGLTVALFIALLRAEDLPSQIGFAATISGAVGNIIDRVQLHYVRDFIFWHGGFNWPNFNIADMLVVTGVAVLILFGGRKKEPAAEGAKEPQKAAAK